MFLDHTFCVNSRNSIWITILTHCYSIDDHPMPMFHKFLRRGTYCYNVFRYKSFLVIVYSTHFIRMILLPWCLPICTGSLFAYVVTKIQKIRNKRRIFVETNDFAFHWRTYESQSFSYLIFLYSYETRYQYVASFVRAMASRLFNANSNRKCCPQVGSVCVRFKWQNQTTLRWIDISVELLIPTIIWYNLDKRITLRR